MGEAEVVAIPSDAYTVGDKPPFPDSTRPPPEFTEAEKRIIRKMVTHHKPCYGRGYRGVLSSGKLDVCSCVYKAWTKIIYQRKHEGN